MINAITVCVNYADFLEHTIRNNKEIFYEYLVVTSHDDLETQRLCLDNKVNYLISDRVDQDGGFHKGKAINDGIMDLNCKDWVCVIDADTLIESQSFRKALSKYIPLDENCLYGLKGRGIINSRKELEEFKQGRLSIESDIYSHCSMVGFFHLWNLKTRPFYSEVSSNAGLDDVLMRDSFQARYWRELDCYGIHLGPLWLNHSGRVTEKF